MLILGLQYHRWETNTGKYWPLFPESDQINKDKYIDGKCFASRPPIQFNPGELELGNCDHKFSSRTSVSSSPETDTNLQADLCVSHPARLSCELGSLAYHLHTFVNV